MIRVEISKRVRTKLLSALTAVLAVIAPQTSTGQPAGSGAMGASAGTLTGVVRDNMGSPVAGARVVSGSSEAITDSSGSFTLRGLASGALTLDVRRLGYEPLSSSVTVGDPRLSLELRMKPVGQMLPAVRVRARAEPYESRLAGFNARRAKKLGYYITRDEIERRNDFSMTAALRRIPGVRPYTMSGALGRTVRLPGSTCPPLVFVDGFPASLGSFDLDMIDLAGVEGVEVYLHGSAIPADFA